MAKNGKVARAAYRCAECGMEVPKWVGRCPECQAWGTIEERGVAAPVTKISAGAPSSPARSITAIAASETAVTKTGIEELDRVLGGGIVPGAVVLLAGEPGVGKSTLLLEVVHQWARGNGTALYVTGEESAGQVRLRAERTGALHDRMYLAAESELSAVLGHVDTVAPSLLILDSVQTVASAEVDGVPGGVTQVRAVTAALVALAKERGLPVVLVGHVTKEGSIAGPRVLEHLVDAVLQFEGDRHSTLRLLRGVKNRFGAADEVGCFELVAGGIDGVADPSGLFVSRHTEAAPGTAVTVVVEGKRPMLAEVQALVAPSTLANPRRACSGLDSARVAMVLAVTEKRCGVQLGSSDVYTATVGGMKVREPAADLAVALAIASAAKDIELPADLVALGEVGLVGEVRRVPDISRRLAEAVRLGFTKALVPPDCGDIPAGIKALPVSSMGEVMGVVQNGRAPAKRK
ncbi:DNA repair protein RadA [Sciscionella marina]|uniref:DNA repair protein RadA n=1 Tax=Sciscionella marina TaxID=508770 RepID=UPI0003A579C9|nr:DNA repair protein RadA [Sciscionella marina]